MKNFTKGFNGFLNSMPVKLLLKATSSTMNGMFSSIQQVAKKDKKKG